MNEGFDKQLQDEIQAGLAEAFKGVPVNDEGSNFMNIINPDATNQPETPKAENTETPKESSLTETEKTVENTTTTPPADKPADKPAETTLEKQPEVTPVKSFQEQLAELSGGKFKDWSEVEPLLAPREELDDEMKHLLELKKQGVKFDSDFWKVQTMDYENMTDAMDILAESMKLNPEYKGWSKEEIEFDIKDKYKIKEWSEEGEEPTEIETIMTKRMERDALNAKQSLIDKKNSYINLKKPDPQAELQARENERVAQERWENFVDQELVAKVPKLSFKIDDKDSFDFEIPDSEKKEISKVMKSMTKDLNVFWNQFTDDKGNLDQRKVYEAIALIRNRETISRVLHQNSFAKGAEKEIRTIKNADFTANQTSATQKVDWRDQAQKQVEKHL